MNPPKLMLLAGIRLYRWILSPAKNVLFGPGARCRFTPSCSAYALEAVTIHGAARGLWLTLRRLLRCHPWGGCGHDPVPPVRCDGQPSPAPLLQAPPPQRCCPANSPLTSAACVAGRS